MLLETDPIIFDRAWREPFLMPGDFRLHIVYLHDDCKLTHAIVTKTFGGVERAEIYSEVTTWVRDPETHIYDKSKNVLLYNTTYIFGFTSHGPEGTHGQYGKCKATRIDYAPDDNTARILFEILSVKNYADLKWGD